LFAEFGERYFELNIEALCHKHLDNNDNEAFNAYVERSGCQTLDHWRLYKP